MGIQEFAQKVRQQLMERLGSGFRIEWTEVEKNNQVKLLGLSISSEEWNVAPTIYLNSFWKAYEEGADIAMVADKILQIYREDTPRKNIDISFFKEFGKVRERICYRLVNYEKNRALLEGIPHIPYLDLAVCFFYAYRGEELGKGSILINDSHVQMWGASTEDLFALAQCNSPQLLPWECSAMETMIERLMHSEKEEEGEDMQEAAEQFLAAFPMQVLTNAERVYGATCILYPGVLETIANRLSADLYLLPSSVHEVILLPDTGQMHSVQLKEMVAEVNGTQVEPEEILSDSLYYYDRTEKKVKIL